MTGPETKRPRSDLTRPVRSEWAQVELGFSVSLASDGEGVSVVGQDRPSRPDLLALVAFETGSVHPVAAFEVADRAFGPGPVVLQPSLGAAGAGLLAAGDEPPLGLQPVFFECLAGRARVEPAIQRDLSRSDPEAGQLADRVWEQRVLGRVPQPGWRPERSPHARRGGCVRSPRRSG